MNDSAEGGAWLAGPGRGLPGRARARELVHDAHGHTARTPDGARPGGDGGFGFRPGRAGDLDTLDYSAFFRGLWRRKFLFMAIAILASSVAAAIIVRSEEHTSELQSLMRISYAVFCLKKKITRNARVHRTLTLDTPTTNQRTHT